MVLSVLSALARRIKVPYPTFLAIGGVLLAFVPSGPSWTLEPDLALALFVAPVLLDAAYDTSLRDRRANWRPIASLSIALVLVTAVAVGWFIDLTVPRITLQRDRISARILSRSVPVERSITESAP